MGAACGPASVSGEVDRIESSFLCSVFGLFLVTPEEPVAAEVLSKLQPSYTGATGIFHQLLGQREEERWWREGARASWGVSPSNKNLAAAPMLISIWPPKV